MKSYREDRFDEVLNFMSEELSVEQLRKLKEVLYITFKDSDISPKSTEIIPVESSIDIILKRYILTKQMEGKSIGTLERYKNICTPMLHYINKPIDNIETSDLRMYLILYKQSRKVSNRTLDGMRRCFSSFFNFCFNEGIINNNPCAALKQIKYTKEIKKPFSHVDMVKMQESCTTKRDKALVEFLYATGCRVSEVVKLNRDDINFYTKEVIVLGKGNKQRTVYLTDIASMRLIDYLNSRTDTNDCLFASEKSPYERLSKNGIEAVIKALGNKSGVDNAHPHRYRRTLATNLLDKGMPIQDVACILGHSELSTTQVYCYINQSNVKASYQKYSA